VAPNVARLGLIVEFNVDGTFDGRRDTSLIDALANVIRAIAAAALGVPQISVMVVSAEFNEGTGVLTVVMNVVAPVSTNATDTVHNALRATHNVDALNSVYMASGGTGIISVFSVHEVPVSPSTCTIPDTADFPVRTYPVGSACYEMYSACSDARFAWYSTLLAEQCACASDSSSFSSAAKVVEVNAHLSHCVALLLAFCDE